MIYETIPKMYNILDCAERLRCHKTKIYQLRDEGKLLMYKNGAGKWVCDEEELLRFINENQFC